MSRPRFLADHDFNERIVVAVQNQVPEAHFTRLRSVGLDRSPDTEVLEYAAKHGLIVITHDTNTMPSHFSDGLRKEVPMPGLVLVPQTAPVSYVIEDLVMFWSVMEAEDTVGLIH